MEPFIWIPLVIKLLNATFVKAGWKGEIWIHETPLNFGISMRDRNLIIFAKEHNGKSPYIIVKPFITEAIHPRVLAISASFGHWQFGRTAKWKGYNPNPIIPN